MCDHAARAPAASFRAGRADPDRSPRGVPGSAIVRGAMRCRVVLPAQLRTPHSRWGALIACQDAEERLARGAARAWLSFRREKVPVTAREARSKNQARYRAPGQL